MSDQPNTALYAEWRDEEGRMVQNGAESSAPLYVYADADYEEGDGSCGLHETVKLANEPAIQYRRADLAPRVKPLAFAVTDKDTGKVRIVDAKKYNPLDPDFWISEEARNSCEVVPLYPSPATAPITHAQAAKVRPEAVTALESYQQADEDGIMVLVSRQSIEECLPALKAIAEDGE